MKKLGTFLLSLSLLVGLFVQPAYAAEISSTTQTIDLTSYLEETSLIRGFEVTEDDINLSLAMSGKTEDDFQTTDEITSFLGDIIKADSSNLSDLYTKYSLDENSLTELLAEYGEELNDYIFLNDLDSAIGFYTDNSTFEREADFDNKLALYLSDISTKRGFPVTVDYINSYLSDYSESIDDFETVSDLSDYLGDVINSDLSNLDYIETTYSVDNAAILQLIADDGKSISDFVFLDQIEELVWSSTNDNNPSFDLSMYMDLIKQIGLTDAEMKNLEDHFLSISDYISSAEGQAQMEDISNHLLTFASGLIEKGMADENYKLSDAEINEFASLYRELLSAVKLNVVFSVIIDGVETPYSIEEMMRMDDIKNADYKIAFYNDASELLADAVVTRDFINANFNQIVEDVNNAANGSDNDTIQTVKGGELPKTAGNYIPKAFFGLILLLVGIVTLRRMRTAKSEILNNQN